MLEGRHGWPRVPALPETIYTFEDVLQVGCIISAFIRRCNGVKAAWLAQLVNLIAPIMTVPGGPARRQTTFHPSLFVPRFRRGRALRPQIDGPTYGTAFAAAVPSLDAAEVESERDGALTFLLVNRRQTECVELDRP